VHTDVHLVYDATANKFCPATTSCSPTGPNTDAAADSQNGQQCPANKLVITPKTPIRDGSVFTVKVSYTGKPGCPA
jgi:hypothetical protein